MLRRNVLVLMGIMALGVALWAAEPIKLTFAYRTWDIDYPRFLNWYIPTFEKLMAAQGTPVDIEVVELPAPDDPYREALVMRLAAGTAPDIFMDDTFYIPADAMAGYLKDLTPYVSK